MWSSSNFELLPVLESQTIEEALENAYSSDSDSTSEAESDDDEDADDDDSASALSITIISKNLNTGVKNVALTTIAPEDDSRSWKYNTYYSQANVDHTFYIERHHILRRVFFGLKYKSTSSSSWSTSISEWKKLSNHESYEKTYSTCYQMKARVKYRSTNNFTTYFEE